MKPKKPSLDQIDLAPRGEMIVDLLGGSTPETWRPFGTSYSSHMADWTPAKAAFFAADTAAVEKIVHRATKAELVAWLRARGVDFVHVQESRSCLRTRAMIAIHDAWYPKRFVNAKKAAS